MAKKKITIVIEQNEEKSKNYWFLIYKDDPSKVTPEVQLFGDNEETIEHLRDWTDYIENEL